MRGALWGLGLWGCGFPIGGSGVEATEAREASGFRSVRATSNVDVDVVQGEAGATVTCDDNLLEHLRTEVRGDTLVVGAAGNVTLVPKADCFVVVSTPDLDGLVNTGSAHVRADGAYTLSALRSTGSGRIDVDAVDAPRLELDVTGSGEVVVAGAVQVLDLRSTGSGGVDAGGLVAGDATVLVTGSGDVEITATGEVEVRVTGSGDVRIGGDPAQVERTVTGSGTITVD